MKLNVASCFVVSFLLVAVLTPSPLPAEDQKESGQAVAWIYRDYPQKGMPDKRSDVERMFSPFGFMPGSRTKQITVDHQRLVDENDESKGTCIEYYFEFKRRDDWIGSYTLVDGDSWGAKPGVNFQKLLSAEAETKLALRFKAKGEGAVSFKIGGLRDGVHKSSLPFAREVQPDPVALTKEFKEYEIGPIAARELTQVIDPFCVVTSAVDNIGRDDVRVMVDDIRIEPFSGSKNSAGLPKNWRERLSKTLFIAYTPTGFDPTSKPVKEPTRDDIRADLAAIRALANAAGMEGSRAGIVMYGCRDGLEAIPHLAREANLSVILGVFNPRDKVEIQNAISLLKDVELRETVAACCVGNEAITFRRASLEEIQSAAKQIRDVSQVPITTTEVVQAYGDKRLFAFDFSLVNAHCIFSEIYDPARGATWAINRIDDLIEAAPRDHLIVLKEIGWPAGPKPHFDNEQQARFWRTVLSSDSAKKVNICIFDGLGNVPWKDETISLPGGDKANVGPHWPVLFDNDRKPKKTALEIIELWKRTLSYR